MASRRVRYSTARLNQNNQVDPPRLVFMDEEMTKAALETFSELIKGRGRIRRSKTQSVSISHITPIAMVTLPRIRAELPVSLE